MPDHIDQPRRGSRWRHRKDGIYIVVTVATVEATHELVVVYQSESTQLTWVRPLAEFMDGRFTRIG